MTSDLSAIRRAQTHSLRAAAVTAIVPTALAAQGMIVVGQDALGLPAVFAVFLAAFLELALISSALLARASAMAGRPTGADAIAVWIFSAVSGLFSASHELISVGHGPGARTWQLGALNILAAGVRVSAPLVAAWLWERVLVSARREAAPRTATEIRRDRRLLAFARAAQTLRRLLADQTASESSIRHARRRYDRRHVALLRHVPATDTQLRVDIGEWLTELSRADTRYLSDSPVTGPDASVKVADTAAPMVDTVSDVLVEVTASPATASPANVEVSNRESGTDHPIALVSATVAAASAPDNDVSVIAQTLATPGGPVSDSSLRAAPDTKSGLLSVPDTIQTLTGQSRPTSDTATTPPALSGIVQERVSDTSDTGPSAFADVPDTLMSGQKQMLSTAVEIIQVHGLLPASAMARKMSSPEHPMTERTALRWRNRAEAHRQQRQTLVVAG
jgi:hypothetical protein